MQPVHHLYLLALSMLLLGCQQKTASKHPVAPDVQNGKNETMQQLDQMIITNLGDPDKSRFEAIQEAFAKKNPGYALLHLAPAKGIVARDHQQVVLFSPVVAQRQHLSKNPRKSLWEILSYSHQRYRSAPIA
ncbi:MAG: hypothetical protein HKN87_09380 [Saprospiraceae bacterium]|nr:hypothetical protein [Saprospiraceae bacterium]